MATTLAMPVTNGRSASTKITWVAPGPRWEQSVSTATTPFLAEFDTDRFLPDFLDIMAGKQPANQLKAPASAVASNELNSPTIYKLYQPLHQRYYLVTASLICRLPGLPDRNVVRKNGEKTTFVLRKIIPDPQDSTQTVEAGWVNGGSNNSAWLPVVDDLQRYNPLALLAGEEQLPLHQVKFCPAQQANQSMPCAERIVYHGYIPVDSREKYLTCVSTEDLLQRVRLLVDPPEGGADRITDPRLDEVTTRVVAAWHALYAASPTLEMQQQVSLYVIVDLTTFLQNVLKSVFAALGTDGAGLPKDSNRKKLLHELDTIIVATNTTATSQMTLTRAIIQLPMNGKLARAESEPPLDTYNLYPDKLTDPDYLQPPLTDKPDESGGKLYQLLRDALKEEKKEANAAPLTVPDEVVRLIKDEPAEGDIYFLRMIYERGHCDPVLSDPSPLFMFAKVFDPEAPARPLRVELPSIKLKDLRRYKRGVGMQMSQQLNNVVNGIEPKDILSGKGFSPAKSPIDIAYICSFSIPIITICAFILLFIILILLNIVFWWLPLLRICFPVPARKQ